MLVGLAFVGFPRFFLLIAAFELAIIFSARSMEGHYYADIVAGFLVGGLANWAAIRLVGRFDYERQSQANLLPVFVATCAIDAPLVPLSMPPVIEHHGATAELETYEQ